MIRHSYQYLKIDHYNFCLQQNPAFLAWILFFKKSDLDSICTPWQKKKAPHGIIERVGCSIDLFISNLKIINFFVQSRLKLKNIKPVADLPVYGHLCLHVHKGYKVFNLDKGMVIKLFDSDISEKSITDEIKRLEYVSSLDVAPAMGRSDISERWYEEEYIAESPPSSYKSRGPEHLMDGFGSEVAPCLNRIMLFETPQLKQTPDYLNEQLGKIDTVNSSDLKPGPAGTGKIRQFTASMAEHINKEAIPDIYNLFTHGDFCPANILETEHGIRILDWESAEYRSALFDFYSYFFYIPVCIQRPVAELMPELDSCLQKLVEGLQYHNSDIAENLAANKDLYRRMFYIEYIGKLLDRERTDKNLDITDYIDRYIETFLEYEKISGA